MKQTSLKVNPEKVREFQRRGVANSSRKRRPISPASELQRAKVKDRVCASCAGGPCDPAHLVPRSQGGCDHPACVIGLCRECHRAFDDGHLDLEGVLALPDFCLERAHMALHWPLSRCIKRLRGNNP